MKRELSVIVVVLIVAGILGLTNFAQGAPANPIELKIMHWAPINHAMHRDVFVPWAKMLEERSGGRLKATIYPAEVLGKAKDTYETIVAGTADIGFATIAMTPGLFSLNLVYNLPFVFPNVMVGSKIMWELFEKDPSLRDEFREVKVLWLMANTHQQLHTINKKVHSLEDLKNLRIRTGGGKGVAALRALGAVPVVIAPPDVYTALERGTVDGAVFPWEALESFKVDEVTRYHTVADLWAGQFYVIMNQKKWNSLPPDLQKIIDSISGPWGATFASKALEKYDQHAIDTVKALGNHEIVSLSPDERKRWQNRVRPVIDAWISEKEAKHLPGRRIVDEVLKLSEKYGK